MLTMAYLHLCTYVVPDNDVFDDLAHSDDDDDDDDALPLHIRINFGSRKDHPIRRKSLQLEDLIS